jgi:hypothetical protein
MQTMHVQPGLCRGCFVVCAADGLAWFTLVESPKVAAVASASNPDASSPEKFRLKLCPLFLCFLISAPHSLWLRILGFAKSY